MILFYFFITLYWSHAQASLSQCHFYIFNKNFTVDSEAYVIKNENHIRFQLPIEIASIKAYRIELKCNDVNNETSTIYSSKGKTDINGCKGVSIELKSNDDSELIEFELNLKFSDTIKMNAQMFGKGKNCTKTILLRKTTVFRQFLSLYSISVISVLIFVTLTVIVVFSYLICFKYPFWRTKVLLKAHSKCEMTKKKCEFDELGKEKEELCKEESKSDSQKYLKNAINNYIVNMNEKHQMKNKKNEYKSKTLNIIFNHEYHKNSSK
jgi:hypothetical protein